VGISGEWAVHFFSLRIRSAEKKGLYGCVPQMGVPLACDGDAAMTLVAMRLMRTSYHGAGVSRSAQRRSVLLGLWIRKESTNARLIERGAQATSPGSDLDTFPIIGGGADRDGAKVVETAPFYLLRR